jgi:hypothetical protein
MKTARNIRERKRAEELSFVAPKLVVPSHWNSI